MAANLKVVPFPGANINDIPNRLRVLADMFENNAGRDDGFEDTDIFLWINVTSSGDIETGALGRCHGKLHAVGIMQAAQAALLENY